MTIEISFVITWSDIRVGTRAPHGSTQIERLLSSAKSGLWRDLLLLVQVICGGRRSGGAKGRCYILSVPLLTAAAFCPRGVRSPATGFATNAVEGGGGRGKALRGFSAADKL